MQVLPPFYGYFFLKHCLLCINLTLFFCVAGGSFSNALFIDISSNFYLVDKTKESIDTDDSKKVSLHDLKFYPFLLHELFHCASR